METYYFLFFIAVLWTIFATIQDLKSREVSNWLNFTLLTAALAYRATYSTLSGDYTFLLYGLAGTAVFFAVGQALYYTGTFGGGDARLLRAFGAIIPFESIKDLGVYSLLFILLLFSAGALFSIFFSVRLAYKNYRSFKKSFGKNTSKYKGLFLLSTAMSLILLVANWYFASEFPFTYYSIAFFYCISLLYIYLKSVEESCMIVLTTPDKLTEGDWTINDVKVGSKMVKKTIHGLTYRDIMLLRKYNKSVKIKQGVPFVPAFLIALLSMVLFFLT